MKINFFCENIDFVLKGKQEIRKWITLTANKESKKIKEINFVFCNDDYLLEVNNQYLQHDYFTDIITFDNSEKKDEIESDIFISIDRIKDNSAHLGISFSQELKRVIIHGILHLCGYKDKTNNEATEMREKENHYLQFISI